VFLDHGLSARGVGAHEEQQAAEEPQRSKCAVGVVGRNRDSVHHPAADYLSGSWTGNESDRLTGQIAELKGWSTRPDASAGLKKWASELAEHLEKRRREVLVREAEEER
jgi:hypothetical protein